MKPSTALTAPTVCARDEWALSDLVIYVVITRTGGLSFAGSVLHTDCGDGNERWSGGLLGSLGRCSGTLFCGGRLERGSR